MGHSETRNYYVLISNLDVAEDGFQLADGVTLRRLMAPFTVFDLAAAGGSGFAEWAVLAAFVPKCRCELESAADAASGPGYGTLDRAWLASVLVGLRGYGAHMCVAYNNHSWREVAGHQARTKDDFAEQLAEEGVEAAVYRSRRALPPMIAGLLDLHVRTWAERDRRTTSFGPEDAEWVRRRFETFNGLAATSPAFRYGLEAAADWRFQTDRRAAVARLWSGVEALFGVKSELVFRLSLLVASLLEARGELRESRYKVVKKLYDQRSKAVHGTEMSDQALDDAMSDSYILLRDLLLRIAERGEMLSERDLERLLTH